MLAQRAKILRMAFALGQLHDPKQVGSEGNDLAVVSWRVMDSFGPDADLARIEADLTALTLRADGIRALTGWVTQPTPPDRLEAYQATYESYPPGKNSSEGFLVATGRRR